MSDSNPVALNNNPLCLDSPPNPSHLIGYGNTAGLGPLGLGSADYWQFGEGGLVFASGPNTPAVVVTSGGNVGIGEFTPTTALEVNGTITATSLVLTGGNGASLNLAGAGPTTLNGAGLTFQNIQSSQYFKGNVYTLQQLMIDPVSGQVFYQ